MLFVRANQEKMTAQRLLSFQVEHFLPCCRSVRQWKDRRVTLDMPLFPGYIFVRLPFLERMKVLSLPNVIGLVGSKSSPSIVSPEEIDSIRRGVEFGNAAPHPLLAVGQRVAIVSGVLRGMEGILLRAQNNTRVVISVDSIARSFAVEVDISCLRPLSGVFEQERQAV
ncbi:MAG TPA: UpxY family transcription antiterminator [Candidatus Angelobacter sp.]|nr:UpxY family transcription antiterminator [Candidatus Angelobacter sp.]